VKTKPETLEVNLENIPEAIKAVDRWILWKWEMRKGKWSKTPRQINGKYASTDAPHTWTSFDEAATAYLVDDFDGLGLVLPAGIVGIDLDDCIGTEGFTEEAKMLMAMLPTYCETSPSGTGVKMLATGQLSEKLAKTSHARGIELYDGASTNRYFAITGNAVGPIRKITGQRDSLFAIQTMITEPANAAESFESDPANIAKAIDFLSHIRSERANDYDDWLKVGMALSWCDKSDEMLERWMHWSRSSEKFDEDVCRAKWESFKRENGRLLTIGYLDRLAKEDGYDPAKYQTRAITGDELLAKVIVRDYLIEDFMVRGEPMIIGGASKSLKTSVALEMALSIATGTKFLDEFEVKGRQSVMFVSGESGEGTLQDNLRMMAQAKGLDAWDLRDLHIAFKLPKLDDPNCVEDLVSEMREKAISIMFIDPLYRSLRVGDSASNVYAMGAQLDLIAERIHAAGITVVLLHHFRKQGKNYSEQPELEDLSQSGVAEFGRQFLLLKRTAAYQWDGKHSLYFNWGGSAGHQGMRMLDVYTGTKKLGLTWQTTLTTVDDWKATQKEQKEIDKGDKADTLKARILSIVEMHPGVKVAEIREKAGCNRATLKDILDGLEFEGLIYFKVGEKNAKLYFVH
jgi:hypothetical protein